MTANKRLVLDLPAETVEMIQARIARGEFPSASAYVAGLIEGEFALPDEMSGGENSPAWRALMAECDEIERQIDAGEMRMIPAEEVFADLRAHLAELAEREGVRQAAERASTS